VTCKGQNSFGKLCAVGVDARRKRRLRRRRRRKRQFRHSRGGSACPGDSGSPLAVYDDFNGGWTLAGLLSNGGKSCYQGRPAIYTDVADYVDWIAETIASRGDRNII